MFSVPATGFLLRNPVSRCLKEEGRRKKEEGRGKREDCRGCATRGFYKIGDSLQKDIKEARSRIILAKCYVVKV